MCFSARKYAVQATNHEASRVHNRMLVTSHKVLVQASRVLQVPAQNGVPAPGVRLVENSRFTVFCGISYCFCHF